MLVYIDSMITNDQYIPFIANELTSKFSSSKSDVYFIVTEDGYFINVPADTLVSAKLRSDKSSKLPEKFVKIEDIYTSPEQYNILLYRPTLQEWKDGIFSSVLFRSTIQELVISSFFLSYRVYSKHPEDQILLKRNDIKRRLNDILSYKLDVYAKSYGTKNELEKQLNELNKRITLFPQSITNNDFTTQDLVQYRVNRLVGYLLLVARSFGALTNKKFIIEFDPSLSDERIRMVQLELLLDGIIAKNNENDLTLQIDFAKYQRTMSIISEILFDIKKQNRSYYKQRIIEVQKLENMDVIDIEGKDMIWSDGVFLKKVMG